MIKQFSTRNRSYLVNFNIAHLRLAECVLREKIINDWFMFKTNKFTCTLFVWPFGTPRVQSRW